MEKLKFIQNCKGPLIVKTILNENKVRRLTHSNLKTYYKAQWTREWGTGQWLDNIHHQHKTEEFRKKSIMVNQFSTSVPRLFNMGKNSLVFFLLIQWRFIKNIASFLKEAFARSCERILKKVMFKLVVGKWVHNSNTSKNMIRSSVNKFWSQSLRPGLWKTAVPLCASSDLHL